MQTIWLHMYTPIDTRGFAICICRCPLLTCTYALSFSWISICICGTAYCLYIFELFCILANAENFCQERKSLWRKSRIRRFVLTSTICCGLRLWSCHTHIWVGFWTNFNPLKWFSRNNSINFVEWKSRSTFMEFSLSLYSYISAHMIN